MIKIVDMHFEIYYKVMWNNQGHIKVTMRKNLI